MIKHIGSHNGKSLYILYRKVPGEDHMCLVVYPESLPSNIAAEVRISLNSPDAQESKCFAEVLHTRTVEGVPVLTRLHKEGFIKKVQTSQVLVTPNEKSKVRLDELNKIIDELEIGSDAAKKLQELDANSGYKTGEVSTPVPLHQAQKGGKASKAQSTSPSVELPPLQPSASGVLSDQDIAQHSLKQAVIYEAEAKRLRKEAAELMETASSTKTKNGASKETKEPV